MIIDAVKEQLTRDVTQRLVYGSGLIFWTYVMYDRLIDFPNATSSLGVDYLTLYLMPALILFLQIIRNNQLLWVSIFGLFTLYLFVSLYTVISDAIERSGNHVKAIDWEATDILILIGIFVILGLIDWVIFRLKPGRLI